MFNMVDINLFTFIHFIFKIEKKKKKSAPEQWKMILDRMF